MKRTSKIKGKVRKILSWIVAIALLVEIFPYAALMQVEASTTIKAPMLTETQVIQKIKDLAKLLEINNGTLDEGKGVYFTYSGDYCSTTSPHGSCDNCRLINVITASWFKNKFGNVSFSLIPGQYNYNGSDQGAGGATCFGFANFALWYVFASSQTDDIYRMCAGSNLAMTKANFDQYVKPGDVIRYGNSNYLDGYHSFMFISAGVDSVRVLDCNIGTPKPQCKIHDFSYSAFSGYIMSITRATNYDTSASVAVDTTPPVISDVQITDVDNTGYTISCVATDNIGVMSVAFPTWTHANGQDDLQEMWPQGFLENGRYTVRINVSDHNNETGLYITHIYAYDAAGNYAVDDTSVSVTVDTTPPVISDVQITNVDNTGYTISCVATDNIGVTRVAFPTWTDANGQDDLQEMWPQGFLENGRYTVRINVSDHNNETGLYITHIYAYDAAGNYAVDDFPAAEVVIRGEAELPEPPSEPTTPTQPEPSTKPTTPTQPEPSTKPTTPTQPEPSTKPTTPTQPEPSTKPTTPTQPEPSTKPTTPTQSEPSTKPTTPTQPEPSTKPTTPTQPEPSTKPTTPAESDTKPENPATSPDDDDDDDDDSRTITVTGSSADSVTIDTDSTFINKDNLPVSADNIVINVTKLEVSPAAEIAAAVAQYSANGDSAKIYFYDITPYLGAVHKNNAVTLSKGGVNIHMVYPEGADQNSEIIVLQNTSEVNVTKDGTGYWISADGVSPYTVIVKESAAVVTEAPKPTAETTLKEIEASPTADAAHIFLYTVLAGLSLGIFAVFVSKEKQIN